MGKNGMRMENGSGERKGQRSESAKNGAGESKGIGLAKILSKLGQK